MGLKSPKDTVFIQEVGRGHRSSREGLPVVGPTEEQAGPAAWTLRGLDASSPRGPVNSLQGSLSLPLRGCHCLFFTTAGFSLSPWGHLSRHPDWLSLMLDPRTENLIVSAPFPGSPWRTGCPHSGVTSASLLCWGLRVGWQRQGHEAPTLSKSPINRASTASPWPTSPHSEGRSVFPGRKGGVQ